jgi:acylphosphatase
MARAHVVISGRVQGVGYRYSLKRVADSLGVDGWCRNNRDGSVEAAFSGERGAIESLIDWCRQGPSYAAVSAVCIDWSEETAAERGFSIRR